jgi:flagella basal body P-ring formation protein FlgA
MARRPERADRGAVRLDPRLLIGIVLIAASTTGVWALVSGLDDSVEVYAARGTITPGTRIDAADLDTESVRLGATAGRYLAPGDLPDGGLVVTRTIEAGELVPDSAVD